VIDSSDMNDGAAVCAVCQAFLGGGGYVQAEHSELFVFCSEPCFRFSVRARSRQVWRLRRQRARRLSIAIVAIAAFITPHHGPSSPGSHRRYHPAIAVSPAVPELTPLPAGWFGPEWPPTDTSVLAALGRDAWIHPLAGPVRRMPRTDSRVFGAVRPGDRAVECRNGHCGVDLGGEIWGEHVRAVHDGVVDFVQRGLNPDHGGRFVRLSHREGTVFTQYFHLAAIPRGLERGTFVKGGDVIGLLGDSGVKESAPHLHFALSIRPAKGWPERYVDPEPLIALWPLRVPVDGSEVGLVSIVAEPGLPLGSALLRPANKRKLASRARARRQSADSETNGPVDEGAATVTPPVVEEPPATGDPPEAAGE
jgi:murein DD-endopeptidase MepM/ murein hydrolase activator NlpD